MGDYIPTRITLGPVSMSARLGLLIATVLVVFGLRFFWASMNDALWFQINLGYYVVLTLLVAWLGFLFKAAKASGWLGHGRWRSHAGALFLILGVTLFLHVHEAHVMRVLFDEPTHALGALVMHWEKKALMAGQSNYVGDAFVLTRYYASFRQYLFSLLVSLLHDFTGYRLANVYVLNFFLTPITLLVGYLLAFRLGGRLAGFTAVGLLGTLPLLSQNVTSGGYDLLNMALVGGLILSTLAYAATSSDDRDLWMNFSLATALLLGATRYESVLYLFPWAGVTLVLWWREGQIRLTWFAIVSPLFLLPNFMSNLLMMNNERAMYSGLRKGGEAFFDISYLPKHISEALFYFFNFDRGLTNSVLLAALGALGFVAFMVRFGSLARFRKLEPVYVIFALFAVWTSLIYLFMLTQFWSSPTDGLASRFCLSLMLIWAVLAGWLVSQIRWLALRPKLVYGGLVIWCVIAAAPSASRAAVSHALMTGRADKWFIDFASARDRTRTLYVANSNVSLIAHRFASSDIDYLAGSPAVFVRAIKAGLYRDVIVFQTLEPEPKSGQWRVRAGYELPDSIVTETIDERILTPIYKARILRLVGYKGADGVLITSASDSPEVALKQSFANDVEWSLYRRSIYP